MSPDAPLSQNSTVRRWRPTVLVWATLAVHAASVAVLLTAQWRWAIAALIANHALITAVGLWPRSRWLGPNWTSLPQSADRRGRVAITIDDGPDPEVTPLVLELLERHGARATFFCIGERVAAHPDLVRDIAKRGHAVENHSQRHLHRFSLLGPRAMADEIRLAQITVERITGETPCFFRAPAGLRNPFLDPVLARSGLRLASWTRRGFDTVERDPDTVLARLTDGLRSGDILLLHDGHAARTADGRPIVVAVLPALLKRLADARLDTITLRAAL